MANPRARRRATPPSSGARGGILIAPTLLAEGEPVEDLPAMVEMVGFDEALPGAGTVEPPALRSFLRPPALAAAPEEITPLEIPAFIEPTAERGRLRESLSRGIAVLRSVRPVRRPQLRIPAVALPARSQWRAPAVKLPAWPRPTLPTVKLPAWPRPTLPAIKLPAIRLPAWRSPRMTVIVICAVAASVVVAVVAASAWLGPMAPPRTAIRADLPPPPDVPADRLAYYQKAADAGNAEAQLQLGILYAKGEGAPQDYAVAAKWFRAAADGGSARAQYDLGVLYERGRGVPVDLAESAKWYLKAAEGKYPLAQFNLAVCYTKGQGVRKDLAEAALWYRRAALQGVTQGMVNLATMYERGDGVSASPVDAYAWYLAAARRGDPLGTKRSGELFATLPKLDQIRAEALASDVAASIHDYNSPPPAAATVQPGPSSAASR